jgi:hypothetical protein
MALVAALSAISVIQISRAQARAQHGELIQRLERLETMLAATGDRSETAHAGISQGSPSGSAVLCDNTKRDVEKADISPEKRAEHAQILQAGNDIVDRAIQSGQWSSADMGTLLAATNGLSTNERGDIVARLSAAINAGQIHPDMRRRQGR